MIISDFIKWLETLPQDAVVQVLEHYSDSGWSAQGGWCYTENFTTEVDYQQWKEEGDTSPPTYIYGKHFELNTLDDVKYLQLGVKDK